MGVLPLQFMGEEGWKWLGLNGSEIITIHGIAEGLKPRKILNLEIASPDGARKQAEVLCRIDTLDELDYFRHGGILPYVLRNLATAA